MSARHRHVWVEKFGVWCRRCLRTALFVCSCGEGRCFYHAPKSCLEEQDAEAVRRPPTPGEAK